MKGKKGSVKERKAKAAPVATEETEAPVAASPPEEVAVQTVSMQTTVSRLRETLKLLQPVVPKKTNLPVLNSVLFKDGKAMANNLEVTVVLDYPDAQGGMLIPHRSVQELLKFVPGNETLTVEQKGKHLKLSWDSGKSTYDVLDPQDYPEAPEVKETKTAVTIEGDRLVPTLMAMVDYCSTEDNRPMLTGVNLSLGINTEVAAADGFRLVYETLPIASPMQDNMIIPASSIRILDGLWRKVPAAMPLGKTLVQQIVAKRHFNLTRADGVLWVQFGEVTLITKLIEGTFPAYKKLIPEEPPTQVRVFAMDLERAVQRIKEIAGGKDGSGKVIMEWTADSLVLSANSAEKGKAESKIKAQIDGQPGEIAINVSYLLEYLKGKEGLVSIGLNGSDRAMLLRHSTSPVVVIMPMSLPT